MPLPLAQQVPRGHQNALHYAADSGSVERTLGLLSSGLIGIDEGDPIGWTPLMFAIQRGHVPVARILVTKGANLAIVNDDGFTALLLATQQRHLAITEMLMKAGADIETVTSQGLTPLHVAADYGHSEVMKLLIHAGANADSRLPSGQTPLALATQRGFVDAVRELLRAEANPLLTWRTQSGETWVPLHAAIQNGHSEVARELVHQVGIEGCCGGKSGAVEALRLAAREGHVDIMAMLMEAGVIDTGDGLVAAAGNGPVASVKLLLQQKKVETTGGSAYANFLDSAGATPLLSCILCCQSCSPRVARLLIEAGADATSEVPSTIESVGGDVSFDGAPLAVTNLLLSAKEMNGAPATEEQLHNLEAVRRRLLRVAAVHAVSWLWPSGVTSTAHAGEAKIAASTPLAGMLPILRRRAGRRRVLLSALFRYSSKPDQ